MIEARGLTAVGRGGLRLGPVDLQVAAGDRLAVIGPTGAGKSLLLGALAGLVRAHGVARRGTVGMIFQRDALDDARSALDNVAAAARARGIARPDEEARGALVRVGLGAHLDMLPRALSGGMRKRVGVARALAVAPDILIADDPTAGLDPATAGEVLDLLLSSSGARERATIIATQDVDVVLPHVRDVLVLRDGQVAWRGEPSALGAVSSLAAFAPRPHAIPWAALP